MGERTNVNKLIMFSKPEISNRDLKPGHNIWNMDWGTVHRVAESDTTEAT